MASAIRFLTVAFVALFAMVGIASAQSSGGGFTIPDPPSSLGGDATALGAKAREAANAASRSMGLPEFTGNQGFTSGQGFSSGQSFSGGVNQQPVGPRSGGPTTDPTNVRDNSWLSDSAAARRGRPSTAPFGASQTGTGLPNGLRPNTSSIATVAATEDPNSAEARARARAQSGNAAAAPNTSGFGSLPKGVTLPERNSVNAGQAAFASQLMGNAGGGSGAATTVFGPKTAEEANFDWSVYNARNANPGSSAFAGNLPGGTAQANLGQQNYGQSAAITAAAANQRAGAAGATGLGLPGATVATTSQLPSNWTYQQIAALGEYYGVQSNDRRMSDPDFVNRLYATWQEEQKAKQPGLAGRPSANAGGITMTLPGFGADGLGSQNVAAGNPQTRIAAATNQPIGGSAVNRSNRRVDLFDSFGNRIDAEGNILDANGQPVDEATRYELTIGKKIRQDLERIAKEQAELERRKLEQQQPSPSDRLGPLGNGNLAEGSRARQPGQAGSASTGRNAAGRPDPDLDARLAGVSPRSSDDLSSGLPGRAGSTGLVPGPDRASLGDAAKAIGRSNPYVNVFLLCSLVANIFLFVWLQRLWYHHRDLIASSRMAASGISTSND